MIGARNPNHARQSWRVEKPESAQGPSR